MPDLLYTQYMGRTRSTVGPRLALASAGISVVACAVLGLVADPVAARRASPGAQFVVHVSVDGLRPDAVTALGAAGAPNFHRLHAGGAGTDNARTDYDLTNTLPNHVCILTGRAVLGPQGHGVDFNDDTGTTLEAVHGSYVAGVFDVVHDNGLGTGMYVSKSKLALLERSWNAVNGAPDITGEDDGRDKIDRYLYLSGTAALVDSAIAGLRDGAMHYLFIHLRDPDTAGHASGWMSSAYLASVAKVDSLLGLILDAIEGNPLLDGSAAVIVTADHGGAGTGHSDPGILYDYTVPVYVWGRGAAPGTDLYMLNPSSRENPGAARPDYGAVPQPIRNGGTSNLALALLGLPAIPGSTVNEVQDLATEPLTGEEGERGWDSTARVFPNPSGGRATVSFSLATEGPVEISLYDARGRLVEHVRFERLGRGTHEIGLGEGGLPPGVYFYGMNTAAWKSTGKLVLLR